MSPLSTMKMMLMMMTTICSCRDVDINNIIFNIINIINIIYL